MTPEEDDDDPGTASLVDVTDVVVFVDDVVVMLLLVICVVSPESAGVNRDDVSGGIVVVDVVTSVEVTDTGEFNTIIQKKTNIQNKQRNSIEMISSLLRYIKYIQMNQNLMRIIISNQRKNILLNIIRTMAYNDLRNYHEFTKNQFLVFLV